MEKKQMKEKLIKEDKKEADKKNDSKWKQFTQQFSTNTWSKPDKQGYSKF